MVTPLIEVAGDAQTAKCLVGTVGCETGPGVEEGNISSGASPAIVLTSREKTPSVRTGTSVSISPSLPPTKAEVGRRPCTIRSTRWLLDAA